MIRARIDMLRQEMKKRNIDAYLIPTADFHESEYVGGYFKCREYMTGFTGSAGIAVIMAEEAGLWTDGRYFIQAENELQGSGVTLYRMGQEGVPALEEFLPERIPEGGCLGFDGRVVSTALGNRLETALAEKQVRIAYQEDLVGVIWQDRPALSCEKAFILAEKYAGESAVDKIGEVRAAMARQGVDIHILTSLPDINWLFNIRGNDIPYNPVVLSYAVITGEEVYLFAQDSAFDDAVKGALKSWGVTLQPYEAIYSFVERIKPDSKVLLDSSSVNYAVRHNLPSEAVIIDQPNPTLVPKAVKNPVECGNMRKAHIKDGVAVTKFMYWLKKNIGKIPMSEISAADYLESLRKEQEGYIELSFDTISAYKENAAMCHYSATKESNKELAPDGMLLVDSGGHYYEGTTDITRTFVIGPVTDEMRMHFTLVAVGMLRLMNARFLYGCKGLNLDYIARGPLWQRGLDYNHGTGHGVGYLLSVHEPPNGIRWKQVPERIDSGTLEEGMITSDEPGLYFEGKYGIRTENLLLCHKGEKNEYGQFMKFESLTCVPIDLDGIDPAYLELSDLEYLNNYHETVYHTLAPHLSAEEREWLKEYTKPVKR